MILKGFLLKHMPEWLAHALTCCFITPTISFTESSLPWPAVQNERLWSNFKKGQIWLAVEKWFHFLTFYHYLVFAGKIGCNGGISCTKNQGEGGIPHMSKTIAAFKCDCYTERFLEADWLSTRSQKNVHARAVVQPEQEFWIIPEPPASVSLDKGNEGSGNEILVFYNSGWRGWKIKAWRNWPTISSLDAIYSKSAPNTIFCNYQVSFFNQLWPENRKTSVTPCISHGKTHCNELPNTALLFKQ